MTNNLKCPFCGAELDKQIKLDEHYACLNTENCEFSFMVLPKKWWQALIDGKAAQDALKKARELYESLAREYCETLDDYKTVYSRKSNEYCVKVYMQEYDKEITSITTQEKE